MRTPDVQMGDLRAQIAANNTGIRRVLELVDLYGVETLHESMDEIMDYSERRMRKEIGAMPDGVYSGVDYMEDIMPGGGDVEITARPVDRTIFERVVYLIGILAAAALLLVLYRAASKLRAQPSTAAVSSR